MNEVEGVCCAPDVGTTSREAVLAGIFVVDERAWFGIDADVSVGIEETVLGHQSGEGEQEKDHSFHAARVSPDSDSPNLDLCLFCGVQLRSY